MPDTEIGFIGLGALGAALAGNFLKAGCAVRVWNRTPDRADRLVEAGARQAASKIETVSPGGVLVSCIADDAAFDAVFGDGAALDALAPGGLHISASTLSPGFAADAAARHAARGVDYVSAPVAGRADMAAQGKHRFVLSGSEAGCACAEPILRAVSAGVLRIPGGAASAAAFKLALNLLVAGAIEAMAEAFAYLEAQGVASEALLNFATDEPFNCPLYASYGRQILQGGGDPPAFRLRHGAKDMRLLAKSARDLGGEMPLAEVIAKLLGDRNEAGEGDLDWTAAGRFARRAMKI
ncbi:MAG: NAD(P)-dependent oxidoreductase [Parvularculaceae bacterium]